MIKNCNCPSRRQFLSCLFFLAFIPWAIWELHFLQLLARNNTGLLFSVPGAVNFSAKSQTDEQMNTMQGWMTCQWFHFRWQGEPECVCVYNAHFLGVSPCTHTCCGWRLASNARQSQRDRTWVLFVCFLQLVTKVFSCKKLNPNVFSFAKAALHVGKKKLKKENRQKQQLFFDFTAGSMLGCSSGDAHRAVEQWTLPLFVVNWWKGLHLLILRH